MDNSLDSRRRVLDGRSWDEFCETLRQAGQVVLQQHTPATELDRSEGWRYLSRLVRIALESQLEYADPDFPVFYAICHATAKMGADNPDNNYRTACIRGDRDYRIWGTRGAAPYLSFGTKANRFGSDGSMASTGELGGERLAVAGDGTFEIVLSQLPQPGNWLPVTQDSNLLVVRETFLDRTREKPASMAIECIDGPLQPQPLTAQRLDTALRAAGAFVRGTAAMFVDWTESFRPACNMLNDLNQGYFQRAGGDPNIHYCHGYWSLEADEALCIHTEIPECVAWNFQLDNYWMESLDYRYLPVCLNKSSARPNADGSVTIIVGARNPGVTNFITTGGHSTGTMLLRWVLARTHPLPKCEVVKLSELATSAPV
jgi:hypothetical protein